MAGRVVSEIEKLEQQAIMERNMARSAGSEAIAAIHTSLAEGYEALAKTMANDLDLPSPSPAARGAS